MPLTAGTRLGPYEIVAPIGAGGMGEVYKARDTRLDRVVAVKVSKEQFSERFDREARAVAALNHPGICTLFDVGPNYLVMEYIDGSPMKAPLPLDQAIQYGIQICDALAAAHKKGITHRDLKPANILVTKSGIKLLDFGLAKRAASTQTASDETLTMALTGKNEIVGTLYYMSPEQLQAQGSDREIDTRSDIFSFGVVLYEMLTGKRAFDGTSMASVIAAIMERPAPSIGDVAPAAVDRVLKTCLEKDPDDRWQSARDLKRELERIATAPEAAVQRPSRLAWIAAGALAIALAAALWSLSKSPGVPADRAMMHLDLDATPDEVDDPVISPDGSRIVFEVRGQSGSRLATRRLDQTQTTVLPDTEGARYPFFSPDGKSIGFFSKYAGGQLKTMPLDGGAATGLAEATYPGGAIWAEDGAITVSFDQWKQGFLTRIPSSGGTLQPLTKRERAESQLSPQYLPGGKGLLFTRKQGEVGYGFDACVYAPGRAEPVVVVRNAIAARYLPSGHLVFLRQGKIFAVRFDLDRLQTVGDAIPIVADVWEGKGVTPFSVSNTGILAYRHGNSADRLLVSVDTAGKQNQLIANSGAYVTPRVSPDGTRVALVDLSTGTGRILIHDIARGVTNRLTMDDRPQGRPSWSPDGTRVFYFEANRLLAVRADGGGQPVPVDGFEGSWRMEMSNDGKLATWADEGNMEGDVWIAPVEPNGGGFRIGKRVLLAGGQGQQIKPVFSPDRRFVAYMSNESGVFEIYVVSLTADGLPAGGKWQISKNTGYDPKWPAKGGNLFYGVTDAVIAVSYTSREDSFLATSERRWQGRSTSNFEDAMYDVFPDGKQVISIVESNAQKPETHVRLVLNFADEVRRRLSNSAK